MPNGPYLPSPSRLPEMLPDEARAAEIERTAGSLDDFDEMHDHPASARTGGWLVGVMGIQGIEDVFAHVYTMAGIL